MPDGAGGLEEDLVAIPRLAEAVGVTPRQLRYWEEQGLISPSRERGRLRYSPRDLAIAGLIKRLLEAGHSVDGLRMLRTLSERDVRESGYLSEARLAEIALRILYQRKAFAEVAGMGEEHFPGGAPGPPPRPPGPHRPTHR